MQDLSCKLSAIVNGVLPCIWAETFWLQGDCIYLVLFVGEHE